MKSGNSLKHIKNTHPASCSSSEVIRLLDTPSQCVCDCVCNCATVCVTLSLSAVFCDVREAMETVSGWLLASPRLSASSLVSLKQRLSCCFLKFQIHSKAKCMWTLHVPFQSSLFFLFSLICKSAALQLLSNTSNVRRYLDYDHKLLRLHSFTFALQHLFRNYF